VAGDFIGKPDDEERAGVSARPSPSRAPPTPPLVLLAGGWAPRPNPSPGSGSARVRCC